MSRIRRWIAAGHWALSSGGAAAARGPQQSLGQCRIDSWCRKLNTDLFYFAYCQSFSVLKIRENDNRTDWKRKVNG